MKRCFAVLLLIVFILYCEAEEPRGTPATKEREAAITKAVESIKTFKPAKDTPRAKKEEEIFSGTGKIVIIYNIEGNLGTGLIEFDNNEWIYIALHSWHLDDKIGDIVLAIDNNGMIYTNEGHVCGGIRFKPKRDAESATSVKEFIGNYVSWVKETPWKPLDEKPAWIEFIRSESWGNVGAGMAYSESAKLKIHPDGTWIWSLERKSYFTKYGSHEIEGKGIFRPETTAELRQIIKDTDAFTAKDVEPINHGAGEREGPTETALCKIILNENGKTYEILWSGFGSMRFPTPFDPEKDRKNVKRLFVFLRSLPYEKR